MSDKPALVVDDLELRLFDIGGNSAIHTYSGKDVVGTTDLTAAVGRPVGTAETEIVGQGLNISDLGLGKRIEVHAAVDGDPLSRVGTVRISDYEVAFGGPDGPDTISLELENFVFSILRDRRFTGRLRNESLGSAISRLVSAEASELSTSINVAQSNQPTANESYEGTQLIAAISDVVTEDALLAADDQTLTVDPIPSSTVASIDETDIQPPTYSVGGAPKTRVRVEGGEIRVDLEDAAQPTTDETRSLLDGSGTSQRFAVRLSPVRVSSLSSLDISTINNSADGTLIARLHPDDGGTPLEPSNPDRAVATRRLDTQFVAADGRSTIEWPDHDLRTDPWLILTQRADAVGSPTAIDVRGTLDADDVFRPSATSITSPQPVVLQLEDETQSSNIGRRDGRLQRDSLSTFSEAKAAGDRYLARRSTPEEEVTLRAASDKVHDRSILDAVELSHPRLPWSGTKEFVVVEKEQSVDATLLTTTLTLKQPPGF